jgi:hypothetical protein
MKLVSGGLHMGQVLKCDGMSMCTKKVYIDNSNVQT